VTPQAAIVALRAAVQRFKSWAERYPTKHGEWEYYEDWAEIETAFEACLDAWSPQDWTDEIVNLMLFSIARSSETERLINQLRTRPEQLLALARAGLHSEDPDARWQLAHAVGKWIPEAKEAEPLLERFFDDRDEYVSRRALIALGDRGSIRAEALALRAWETGHEYQRMAALGALRSINSAAFGRHLALALEDGREYLVEFATKFIPPEGRS
jgi:HEAT repeat protein